jgi:ubiquinone/menaquinone biosynthesis C-methylase UbiE
MRRGFKGERRALCKVDDLDETRQARMSFKDKDHFSGHADQYEAFRPTYPSALFAYLATLCTRHELAWDCATGNGQAAVALAPYFGCVIATDASEKQIDQARPNDRVHYFVAPADAAPLENASVDLVTVAQALHWFDLPRFYAEVKRVTVPGGVIAVWCYQRHTIAPEIDAIVDRFYSDIVGADWPPERRLVEEGYHTLPFPFVEVAPPRFEMVHSWDLNHVLGYLGSWSSTQRYRKRTGDDPLDLIRGDLVAAWDDPRQPRNVTWPLQVRVGQFNPGS